jgi:GAF domain-containing protein
MSGKLAEILLRIAARVAADGGAGVRQELEAALRAAAPFDAGELVYLRAQGERESFQLGGSEGELLGRDLLAHVLDHGAPHRIDDLRDAAPFPETLERLRRQGLRSALVLPFRFEEPGLLPVTGALAVARAHGWAFVGASLPFLGPLAGMAGLALAQSLRLSALESGTALSGVPARPGRRSRGKPLR